jgi:hypothetical protein
MWVPESPHKNAGRSRTIYVVRGNEAATCGYCPCFGKKRTRDLPAKHSSSSAPYAKISGGSSNYSKIPQGVWFLPYSIREELVDPEEFGAQRPAALVPHSCRVEVVLKAERQMKMTSHQWPYAMKSGRHVRFSVELADLEHDR